jgi:hypothetical protein
VLRVVFARVVAIWGIAEMAHTSSCGTQVGIFRRGKYAAGKRVGKGNVVNKVCWGPNLG